MKQLQMRGTMEIFNCPSCGAQIVTDATTVATYCYYCHNPVVLAGRLSGEFFYQKMSYPLQLKKTKRLKKISRLDQEKWFIPRDFFQQKSNR